ncbi:MAG: hypothetical protein H7269_01985 [Cellulomonas sp.]|nr:hypothetical protein [Cellulomonas sp.]
MSQVSALRGPLDALRSRRPAGPGLTRSPAAHPAAGVPIDDQRDALAQVLYLADQGFWASGDQADSAQGTAWGTSTERYLREGYLDRADAILAAGFRQVTSLSRESIEDAHRLEGSTTDPDDWIVVAWALGIEVESG